jgi:hypothetical protein
MMVCGLLYEERNFIFFVLQDHLGNLKTNTDDTFVVRVRHNGRFTARNYLGTVTNIGPGKYAAMYTPTWKRNALSDDGWDQDYVTGSRALQYDDIGPSGIRRKFHDVLVSQAVQGGLFATYYSVISESLGGALAAACNSEPCNVPDCWLMPYRTKLQPTVSQSISSPTTGCIDDMNTFGVKLHFCILSAMSLRKYL